MTTINATISFAKQRPVLMGVLAVLAALILGVCIAFAVGLTNPTTTHADDFGDESGIDLGDNSAVDVGTGDTGIDLGDGGSWDSGSDTGIDLNDNGTDLGDTNPVDVGTGIDGGSDLGDTNPVDVGTGDGNDPDLGNAPDTSTFESPVNTDTNLEPCCTDTIPDGDINLGNAPDTSTFESPVNTDTNLEPCCTDTTDTTPPENIPPVDVPPIVTQPAPLCTLSASPTTIAAGGSSTLTWTTLHAASASIDQHVGSVATHGSKSVSPTVTTTYTLTVLGTDGEIVNCTTTVIVPSPTHVPACTLSAGPATIQIGSNSTLTWTTTNATSFTINGKSETPVAGGSITVNPLLTTTYTGVATGPDGSVNCSTTVTVTLLPPPPSTPACTLTGNPTSIDLGGYATLTWTTTNAVTFSIDQGIGSKTPVAGGHTQVAPTVTTTYTGTATASDGTTVNCTTTIIVVPPSPPPPHSPECTLTANPTYINQGGSSTLTWTSSDVTNVVINNGVGSENTSGSTSVSPANTTTYTGTFSGPDGTITCQTTVIVTPPNSCSGNCGGGGGGGGGGGQFISFQGVSGQIIQPPAAAYVSLSQIPYTGLDLGPIGTVIYWITLILICLAAAYLILFSLVPFLYRRMQSFGLGVSNVLNQPAGLALAGGAGIVAGHGIAHSESATPAPAYKSAYTMNQGFRSFAEGNTLTIDDIVKGLAREAAIVAPVAVMAPAMTSQDLVAMSETRPSTSVAYTAPVRAEQSAPVSTDVRDFIAALLNGDRTTVFSSYRQMIREGGDGETFLTQVVCAIDDAYRARVEGTYVHPEIAALTASCATPFLEKLTSALTNAVDSSYSPGVTGGKLALTRALAVVEG